ncbi:MAG: hypothetical protein JWN78_3100 [Bacteroidota bacterium]|nr:hypothetical protein [Bacteroidota bacterium]
MEQKKEEDKILTAKQVMQMLQISENTLLRLEAFGTIKPSFRLSNRKRYLVSHIMKQLKME